MQEPTDIVWCSICKLKGWFVCIGFNIKMISSRVILANSDHTLLHNSYRSNIVHNSMFHIKQYTPAPYARAQIFWFLVHFQGHHILFSVAWSVLYIQWLYKSFYITCTYVRTSSLVWLKSFINLLCLTFSASNSSVFFINKKLSG